MKNIRDNLDITIDVVNKAFNGHDVNVIIEIGARDCAETVRLANQYEKAKIFTFECNPATIEICRERVAGLNNVTLIEKAITNTNGQIKFYPTNPEKTMTTWPDGNPGASSIFKASGKYPVETYIQDEIVVEAVTLYSFLFEHNLDSIDLLWMDIQGAELSALQGLGKSIENVKIIQTEIEFFEIYEGQPLFDEVRNYLRNWGFYFAGFTARCEYFADAIFINKKIGYFSLVTSLDKYLPFISTKVSISNLK